MWLPLNIHNKRVLLLLDEATEKNFLYQCNLKTSFSKSIVINDMFVYMIYTNSVWNATVRYYLFMSLAALLLSKQDNLW